MSELPRKVSILGREFSLADTGERNEKVRGPIYQLLDNEGRVFTHPLLSMIVSVALERSVIVVDLGQGKMTIGRKKK